MIQKLLGKLCAKPIIKFTLENLPEDLNVAALKQPEVLKVITEQIRRKYSRAKNPK